MKKFLVTVQAEVEVSFDENSPEFKELFENYVKYFSGNGSYEDFAEGIALQICTNGVEDSIEGIGVVEYDGEPQTVLTKDGWEQTSNPINVNVETRFGGTVDFEIYHTQEV